MLGHPPYLPVRVAHEWTAHLAADGKVFLPGKQNAQLSDLSAGMRLFVALGVDGDKIVVTAIWAPGQ